MSDLLTESGIKLPKDTKAVKLLHHEDMDGVFSAILTYRQLLKQGFTPDKIKIESVQYGKKDNRIKAMSKNKQAIVVVDFAAMPKDYEEDMSKESLSKLKSQAEYWKKDVEQLDQLLKGDDFSDEAIDKIGIKLTFFKRDIKGLSKEEQRKFVIKKRKEMQDLVNLREKQVKIEKHGVSRYKKPDFISDHHVNTDDRLLRGKAGNINQTQFKSDTEHIGTIFAPGISDPSTLKAVSRIDSATFSNALDNVELPTKFKEAGRMERLAIITNKLIANLFGNAKFNKGIEYLIRNSQPSVVSVYNTINKVYKFNDRQKAALEELTRENPNWDLIAKERKELGPMFPISKSNTRNLFMMRNYEGAKERAQKTRESGEKGFKYATKGGFKPSEKKELEYLTSKHPKGLEGLEKQKKVLEVTKGMKIPEKKPVPVKEKEEGSEERKVAKKLTQREQAIRDRITDDIPAEEQEARRKEDVKYQEDKVKRSEEEIKRIVELNKRKEERRGSFEPVNDLIIRSENAMGGRYTSSFLSRNGQRFPFTLKRSKAVRDFKTGKVGMNKIQIAASPDIDEDAKESMDLVGDVQVVLDTMKKRHPELAEAFEKMKKASGGHHTIASISGGEALTRSKMTDSAFKRMVKTNKIAKRALRVGDEEKFEKMMPNRYAEWKARSEDKDNKNFSVNKLYDEMEELLIDIVTKKYAGLKVNKKIDKTYDIKESLNSIVDELLK